MKRPLMLSAKKIALDKTNTRMMVIVGFCVFVSFFSIVAVKNMYSQMRYQSKVTSKKEKTLAQTKVNISEVEKLMQAYQQFSASTENIIGGNPKGSGDRDGENAKIVLDALPSKYDFPALTSSLDKLLSMGGFKITSVTGTDLEATESSNSGGVNPQPVEMPFVLSSSVNTADGAKYLELFEKSIRPIVIDKVSLNAKGSSVDINLEAKTYYQPEKKMNVTDEVVRR